MIRKLVPIHSFAWRAAVVLLSVEIAAVSLLRYVAGSDPPPPPILANAFANPFLVIHAVAGVTALLVAPLQFVRPIRTRWPALHRATGRIYLAACAIGAPSGLMLALGTVAGPVARAGFAAAALLWALFTWLGWRAVVERRFDHHRDWMLRSYAMTAAAITLRLMLPASAMLGLPFFPAYRVISWASWLANLVLVEWAIRRAPGAVGRRSSVAIA